MTIERNCKIAYYPHKLLLRDLPGHCSFFILLEKIQCFLRKILLPQFVLSCSMYVGTCPRRSASPFLTGCLPFSSYQLSCLLKPTDLPLPCSVENLQASCQSWSINTKSLCPEPIKSSVNGNHLWRIV